MYKAKPEEYSNYIKYIEKMSCGAVYPFSIAEDFQHGEIFSNSRSVLFWHYCGFAFLYGEYDESFLDFVSDLMMNADRRFILFTNDTPVENYFLKNKNAVIEKRLFFDYRKDVSPEIPRLPDGFELCEINADLLKKIKGGITPYFSWDSAESFIEKGKGYCIVKGDTVSAWAFSAAVSSKEIDIGIETNSEYRCLGLAEIAAKKMIEYCFERNKHPVWACHQDNIASRKLAEKLGFVQTAECLTVGKLKEWKEKTVKEVDPKQTNRAAAFEMWINAPMPMVTLFKTLDVTRLLKFSRRRGCKFNMLMCYCIGKAAAQIEEFYLLPVDDKLIKYEKIAVNTVVKTEDNDIHTLDIPFSDDLQTFDMSYRMMTKHVYYACQSYGVGEDYMVIGTSALVGCDIDGAVNIYAGVYNNPFVIWGKYRKKLFKTTLPVSFQFHHTQMDGGHAAKFLECLQNEINNIKFY